MRIRRFTYHKVLVMCLLVLSGVGCSSTSKFQAEELPVKYQAKHQANPQTLDLTKLATSTTTADLIGAGDVLEVSIAAGLSANETSTFPCRVMDNGTATLPIVGTVSLKGMELQEAEAVIAHTCIEKGLYASPHVTVTMKRPKVNRITVLGAVEKPATYELRSGQTDVLQAIVAAGGLSEDAGIFVQVRHPGYSQPGDTPQRPPLIASLPEEEGGEIEQIADFQKIRDEDQAETVRTVDQKTVRINLASAAVEQPGALSLQDGGIVMVERRDPKPIHVIGLVRRPNRYEYPISEDLRLLDAIALASGTDNPLADKVYIIRNNPDGGEPILIEASIGKAKRNGKADLRLAPGDIVSLEQTPSTTIFETIRMVGFGVSGRLW